MFLWSWRCDLESGELSHTATSLGHWWSLVAGTWPFGPGGFLKFCHKSFVSSCPQVNLKTGVPPDSNNETCTAGAGSLLVEFGILSRLLGDSTFEWVARRAVKALWNLRSNDTGLLGVVAPSQAIGTVYLRPPFLPSSLGSLPSPLLLSCTTNLTNDSSERPALCVCCIGFSVGLSA